MPSVAQFLELLRRSNLIESAKLEEELAVVESEGTEEQLDNIQYVSTQLINRNLITPWQSKQLLKGRYKGFFLRQYKILGHLGSGGMSSVFLAEHLLMQRRVAVKVLPRKRLEKSIYLERFIREAQAIASLDHPNIVRAYDFDNVGDLHYIVMEYFQGENLQTLVEREKKVPIPRIVNTLRQAADALAHAHQIGVIHRDVKPSNILVNNQGEVKVLDLGLALLDEHIYEGTITHIQEDTILGTADYLAPEQALDSHNVDARADIYGLGGVLYFCLTGHPPFPEGSVSKRLLAHQQKEPLDILIDRPETPEDLIALCRKMMSKRPDDRQQSARDVAHDFEDWLIEHGYAEPNEFAPASVSPFNLSKHHLNLDEPVPPRGKLRKLLHRERAEDSLPVHTENAGTEGEFSALGEEDNVNLFGSPQGSTMLPWNELSAASQLGQVPEDFGGQGIITIHKNEKERSLKRTNEPPKQRSFILSNTGWYRNVPIWFWTLFFSGYVAAVFLAGILAALLTFLLNNSPDK